MARSLQILKLSTAPPPSFNLKARHSEDGVTEKTKKAKGIRLILKRYRDAFRIPENLNYYSEEDYQAAERKFVKFALLQGGDQRA